ncbi:MAG: thioredoxin fold domain-containing protein [Chitinophagales bacterium]|nr:thioredoxin domain-containing protein [Chitinophagales bacterium]MCZ2394288.1 thioredoxin fold domain-containing protein [Chitinophagales bacterium]
MTRIFLLLFLAFQSCGAQTNSPSSNYQILDVKEFSEAVKDGAKVQLIDVRTPGEYSQGHITDAQNFDWNGQYFDLQISNLDKSQPVYIYCLSGGRSASAAKKMVNEGFTIYELKGGINNWRANNMPEIAQSAVSKGMSMDDFNKIITDERLVLVDFYAEWCAPCKKMSPYFDNISKALNDKVKVVRIDIDANRELGKKLNITSLPVVKLYKGNEVVWEKVGYASEEEMKAQIK